MFPLGKVGLFHLSSIHLDEVAANFTLLGWLGATKYLTKY